MITFLLISAIFIAAVVIWYLYDRMKMYQSEVEAVDRAIERLQERCSEIEEEKSDLLHELDQKNDRIRELLFGNIFTPAEIKKAGSTEPKSVKSKSIKKKGTK